MRASDLCVPSDPPSLDRRRAVALAGLLVAVLGAASCAGAADSSSPATVATLDADQLCRLVPAAAVAAAVGQAWPRIDDPSGGCRYQSPTRSTSTVTVTASPLSADGWRAQATKAGGAVTDRGGVLVADYGGDGFGPLDELWWSGPAGSTLVLRVDNGVSLEQALAVIEFARHGTPQLSGVPGTTGTTGAAAPTTGPTPGPTGGSGG